MQIQQTYTAGDDATESTRKSEYSWNLFISCFLRSNYPLQLCIFATSSSSFVAALLRNLRIVAASANSSSEENHTGRDQGNKLVVGVRKCAALTGNFAP
ncbi:hypothetical protein AVEN_133201-1 [Araneus ventricosus]|uniref:Uncharacterized protein n=1 Tax=Araneus ventricosus TaxID=182803 RepID=A0A4Y2KC11_ARAVE|nr:hypothetical protein AVEN_133201-1 [Araneus ventricosus]